MVVEPGAAGGERRARAGGVAARGAFDSSARSSGAMSSASWPWSSTSTRLRMRLTRPRSWLATSTLVPRSGSDANSAMISADRAGSRLPVGSSATSRPARATIARAMPTRCCSPADSCVGQRAFALAQAQLVEHARARACRSRRGACRAGSAAGATFSAHAAVGQQAVVLEHHADVAPVQRDAAAAHLAAGCARRTAPRRGWGARPGGSASAGCSCPRRNGR